MLNEGLNVGGEEITENDFAPKATLIGDIWRFLQPRDAWDYRRAK